MKHLLALQNCLIRLANCEHTVATKFYEMLQEQQMFPYITKQTKGWKRMFRQNKYTDMEQMRIKKKVMLRELRV